MMGFDYSQGSARGKDGVIADCRLPNGIRNSEIADLHFIRQSAIGNPPPAISVARRAARD
jgi:hypothetical protein